METVAVYHEEAHNYTAWEQYAQFLDVKEVVHIITIEF
jgi:hypothetical protein